MNVYNYDKTTGEFRGVAVADPDPLRPGEFLIPAFSTPIAPPAPAEGHRAVWQAGVWTELPYEFIAPQEEPLTLEAAKAKKLEMIEKDRDFALYSAFNFTVPSTLIPVTVDANRQSQTNIMLAAQLAQLPDSPESVNWRMADNSIAALTKTDVLVMAAELGKHVQAAYERSWQRKGAVAAAESIEELGSI